MVRDTMKSGFTLIELLVAISIIAVISTIGINSYVGVSGRARDSVRKNDLTHLALALDLYSQQKGKYVIDSDNCHDVVPTPESELYRDVDFAKLINGPLPKDPKSDNPYCYESENGFTYTLYAKLEDGSDYVLTSEEYIASSSQPAPPQDQPAQNPPADIPAPPPPAEPPTGGPPTRPSPCRGFSFFRDVGKHEINITSASPNQNVIVQPVISSWDDISKVAVYGYQHPSPLAPPFTTDKWTSLGTIKREPVYECTRYETGSCEDDNSCSCQAYSSRIVDYSFNSPAEVCLNVSETGKCTQKAPAVTWRASNYSGYYYFGMEVFDGAGVKFYSWNTDNCREDFPVKEDSDNSCNEDDPVYPRNVQTLVAGDDVLLQWKVQNGTSTDTSTAYVSSQPGFSIDPAKRVVSKLKSNSGNVIDATDVRTPAFYKVSAFNSKGESPASNQGYISGIPDDSGTDYQSPPNATNLSISGSTFTWKYSCCINVGIEGWRAVRSDGLVFDIRVNELTTSYSSGTTTASWIMPTAIAGTYYIQAYKFKDNSSTVHFGVKSNTAIVSSASTASAVPAIAPSSVSATTNNEKHPITINWTDSNSNETGFHIYRDTVPLDLNQSSASTNSNSSLQWAYFPNQSLGKHYFAVKTRNSCGEGWSNYIEVDVTGGSVNGISTSLLDLLKTTFQNFFSK